MVRGRQAEAPGSRRAAFGDNPGTVRDEVDKLDMEMVDVQQLEVESGVHGDEMQVVPVKVYLGDVEVSHNRAEVAVAAVMSN